MTEPVETTEDTPRSYSAAEVAALLAAVRTEAAATPTFSATPVPVAQHTLWSKNELLHAIGRRTPFFSEHDARSFHASVDHHFPADDAE